MINAKKEKSSKPIGLSRISFKLILAVCALLFYLFAIPFFCLAIGVSQYKIHSELNNINQYMSDISNELGTQDDRIVKLDNQSQQINLSDFRDDVYGNFQMVEHNQSIIHDDIVRLKDAIDAVRKDHKLKAS